MKTGTSPGNADRFPFRTVSEPAGIDLICCCAAFRYEMLSRLRRQKQHIFISKGSRFSHSFEKRLPFMMQKNILHFMGTQD